MEREVTLEEMLEVRESRAHLQQLLMEQYALPVISFSLNIAGPVKNSPVIRRTFQEGLSRLTNALRAARMNTPHQEGVDQATGCEAILAVQSKPQEIKRLCVELEDEDPLGRLWIPERPWAPAEAILEECAAMSKEAVEEDFARLRTQAVQTRGQQFFLEHGLRGIRGELADGLPAVRTVGLPALEKALETGATLDEAGTAVLVRLIAKVTDTNLIARGGMEGRKWAVQAATALKGPVLNHEELKELDQAFIERNLSPGGCADLLAITYFLHFCKEKNQEDML